MTESIRTSQGTFTAELAGPAQGPLVVLLHGFPLSRHSWRAQLPALGATGYRALAPDQRGYSPGVRPDPSALESYGIARLVADVLELADTCGPAGAPFHVVGHDWGGQVAWCLAARHPERVRSLAVYSRPHPAAFRAAYQENRDGQQERSRHHRAFHDPATGRAPARRRRAPAARDPRAREDPGRRDRAASVGVGQRRGDGRRPLAWYRAAGTLAASLGRGIAAPTLYVWGDADPRSARAPRTRPPTGSPGRIASSAQPASAIAVSDEDPELATRVLLAHLRTA
jgi:pimeloyl-ACP methyl ester carboxylesterase